MEGWMKTIFVIRYLIQSNIYQDKKKNQVLLNGFTLKY